MSLRLRIRDLRIDNDYTQRQIAQMLSCDPSLYSKYERGERELPLALAVRLAQFYQVSLDYLAGLSPQPAPPGQSACAKKGAPS